MKIAILLLAMSFSAVAQQLPNPLKAEKTTPAWYDHAIIYEIYPRSFQDTNGDGVGDLKGVTQRLDYLQKLGIDAIWLTPFFPSSNLAFGYDISNYTDVAPEYGTMADWDNLVAEAKKRNIRVLVDFVLNHTSSQHSGFLIPHRAAIAQSATGTSGTMASPATSRPPTGFPSSAEAPGRSIPTRARIHHRHALVHSYEWLQHRITG